MAQDTQVQSRVESYQRLKKWYLIPPWLTLKHYKVWIKGKVEQSRKGVVPSPTPWCSSYRKGSFRVTLDYGHQLYFTTYLLATRAIWRYSQDSHIDARAWHDQLTDRIRSSWPPPGSPVKSKVECCKSCDHFDCWFTNYSAA